MRENDKNKSGGYMIRGAPRKKESTNGPSRSLNRDHGTGLERRNGLTGSYTSGKKTPVRIASSNSLFLAKGKTRPTCVNPLGIVPKGKTDSPAGAHTLATTQENLGAFGTLRLQRSASTLLPCSTQGRGHGEALAARPRKARTSATAAAASASPRAPRPVRLPESSINTSSSMPGLGRRPRKRHALLSPPPTTAPRSLPRRHRSR